MYLESTYRNPFSEYNANTLDSQQIIDFWASPFEYYLNEITEEDIAYEKTPIIFSGGRGSGKTMLLKHFSLEAQIKRAELENISLKDYLIDKKTIGIYVRFDSPLLSSFDGLGNNANQWSIIFTHFFEMAVCKAFLDGFILLRKNGVIGKEEEEELISNTIKLLNYEEFSSLEEIIEELTKEINYVNRYKSDVLFKDINFEPERTYILGELTYKIGEILNQACPIFKEINKLLLIDEYENFLDFQQIIVNSAMKFSKGIAFRIGMRPMGFHSYDTVSENEHIRENRDYRRIDFENPLIGKNGSGYTDFLYEIAEKRLNSIDYFKENNITNIKKVLGDKEDYLQEALKIVNGRDKHINVYIKDIEKLYTKKNIEYDITEEDINKLRCKENPLYEMQNMRMLLKPFDVDYVIKAFDDYKNKVESEEEKKYKNDFENKYKLSYLFVLRSIYKVESKQYYGFNDFAYLSSGIVGIFIELCRRAFQYAFFSEKGNLFEGHISPEIQTKAALDVSSSEFEQIQRINNVGNQIYLFVKNLGRKFSKRHIDKRITYPETNQFSFDSGELVKGSLEEKVFRNAVKWSVIQKKKFLQQASIGEDDEEIYIINRILAPTFQISIRTRGGFNEKISLALFRHMFSVEENIEYNDIYAYELEDSKKCVEKLSDNEDLEKQIEWSFGE